MSPSSHGNKLLPSNPPFPLSLFFSLEKRKRKKTERRNNTWHLTSLEKKFNVGIQNAAFNQIELCTTYGSFFLGEGRGGAAVKEKSKFEKRKPEKKQQSPSFFQRHSFLLSFFIIIKLITTKHLPFQSLSLYLYLRIQTHTHSLSLSQSTR
jgi:hypothetical protein